MARKRLAGGKYEPTMKKRRMLAERIVKMLGKRAYVVRGAIRPTVEYDVKQEDGSFDTYEIHID